MSKRLVYDDLAEIYEKETGLRARIRSIDSVITWAEKQTDIFETDKEGYFYLKGGTAQ